VKVQIMKSKFLRPAIVAVFLCSLAQFPAFAHEGLVHDGCAVGQSFTAGELTISGAFTRAMLPQAKVGGGYMSIVNAGSEPDRLIGAQTEAAKVVQLHQMKMEGDVMKMGEIEGGIEIPAGETVVLSPGGLHVMLLGVGVPFKEGECLQLMLQFERAGEVPVVLTIGGTAADAAPEGHAH
jgi:copper(I)-binding protein